MMRPFHRVTIRFGPPMRLESHGASELDHAELREFTDALMREISRLSGRPYVDEYIRSAQRNRSADGRGTVIGGKRPVHFHRLA